MTGFEIRTQVHLSDSRAFKRCLSSPGTRRRPAAQEDGASVDEAELTNPGPGHVHTYPGLDRSGALASFRKQFASPGSALPHPVVSPGSGEKGSIPGA